MIGLNKRFEATDGSTRLRFAMNHEFLYHSPDSFGTGIISLVDGLDTQMDVVVGYTYRLLP